MTVSKKLDDQAIFEVARKISVREARQVYLQQVCGEDVAMAQRIEALLQANDDSASFLEGPPPGVSTSPTISQLPLECVGTQIGPYKILQQIGEGGMGTVFMAEQAEPVQRRVALKIIKPGMDTRQVIARFEAERQALAMMDHPNIAKVFDAGCVVEPGGVSPGSPRPGHAGGSLAHAGGSYGRPYFVMELVRGIPITNHCDEHHLTLKQRLELFLPVCQAVQHAHQKGIIHRDLKPNNVLVALYDDKPVPKVIDFGVAKAAQKLTERTMFTELGQVVGTLEYMSPEQARLNQLDIDTRSDIYSLGVLLYELLTGCTPFDGQRLRSAAFDEMLRIVREEDPPKPSTRLSRAETLPSIAASRSIEPARLGRSLRGELDWIVMKALEKDRNRRYETASSFAADLQRYLNDEAVEACPPSAPYRLRKTLRRNKVAVVTTSLVAASLVLGAAVSIWQAAVARDAEARAAARLVAETQARQQATAINQLLQDGLESANPDTAKGNDYTVRQLLDEISLRLTDQLRDQPAAEAAIRATIGNAYFRLGLPEKAAPHLKRALELRQELFGPESAEVASSLYDEAWNLQQYGDVQEAEARVGRALAIHRKLGLRNAETVKLLFLNQLILRRQAREAELVQIGNEAIAIARELPDAGGDMANVLHTLAQSARNRGDHAEADRLVRESIPLHRKFHGDDHPQTARALGTLGVFLAEQGDHDQAEPYLREAIAIFSKHFNHIDEGLLPEFAGLVIVLTAKQDKAGLESLRADVAARAELIVQQRPNDAGPLFYAVVALATVGEPEKAVEIYSGLVAKNLGRPKVWYVWPSRLAWSLANHPDPNRRYVTVAVELAQQAIESAPQDGMVWRTLGVAHYRASNWKAAVDALNKSLELREGGESIDWLFLAMAHWQLDHKDEARQWYAKAAEWIEKNKAGNKLPLRRFRAEAAELLEIVDKP